MRRSTWGLVVLILVGGCTIPPPDLPPATEDGVRSRTGHAVRPPDVRPDGALPPGADVADGVTEDEAVAIALWNNAQLAADLAGLGVAKADLIDAGQLRNPSLQILFPVGPKPFELFGLFPIEQLWQRPRKVALARRQWDQLAARLVQNGLDTTRDARQAHAAVVQARDRAAVAGEAAELRRRIADLTRARLQAGDVSPMEARAADAAAAIAADEASRSDSDIVIFEARLRFVLGLPAQTTPRAVPAAVDDREPPPVESLREQAWSDRPDLRALETGVAVAAARANWDRSRLLTLGAILSAKELSDQLVHAGPGVSFEIPIFRSNAGQMARGDAEVEQAARQYVAQRQKVDLEVTEAREYLRQARASLAAYRQDVLPALRDAADRARKAFDAGSESYLFVLEISRQWIDARLRAVDLEAAVRRASAELDRAVGAKARTEPSQ